MERPTRSSSWRRSPYFPGDSASPPPSTSGGPSPSSPAGSSSQTGSVLKPTSWQQTSSSKAHSQLNPHHHQRRNARRNSSELTFSTPEPKDTAHGATSMSSRKRTRTGDSTNSISFPDPNSPEATAADLDDGPTKGGHSLRRRARVQYATEQIEDEVTVPNSTSSSASRNRKRQPQDDEDVYGPRPKRRNTSHSDTPSSSLRRNPSRRNTINRRYQDGSDADDFESLAVNDPQWDEHQDAMPAATWQSAESSPSSRVNRANASFSDPATTDQPGYQHHPNGDQMRGQTLFSSPMTVEAAPIMTGDTANAYGQQNPHEEYYDQGQEQVQYDLEHHSVDDYPDLGSNRDDSLMPGAASPTAPPHTRDPSMFANDQNVLPGESPIYEGAIAPQAMFDQGQIAEATPPVDPQLMALMDPNNAQNGAKPTAATLVDSPASPQASADDQLREKTPSADDDMAENQQDGSTPLKEPSVTGASTPTRTTPGATLEPEKPKETTLEPQILVQEPSLRETLKDEPSPEKPARVLDPRWCRPQPTPVGRWSNLTPYINGDYTVYPERKPRPEDDDAASEAPSAADKDSDEKDSGKEGEAEVATDENGDAQEAATELPTPALATPARGSPVAEVPELAAVNSPMPAGEEPEDRDSSQEPNEKSKHYRFRKLNDPEEYVAALQNYEEMNTADLYKLLETVHASLETWEEEYVEHGKTVDDYENAQRRRTADIKYENRTRDLEQQSITWEEPEFAVKGYKAKEKEKVTDTKYLQGQDRIMAAAYGFEYDPHPSKIGKQNPETQQAGVTTRGRSLRNQPRQTAKATETDNVVGKRMRKPAQALEPPTQDVSRASTPVPGRGGRRRRNANAEADDVAPEPTSSFNNEENIEVEATGPGRRRRGPRGKAGAARNVEKAVPEDEPKEKEPVKPTGRRGRPRASNKEEEVVPTQKEVIIESPQGTPRRIVTLKIPKGANLKQKTTVTDNGESPPRPSTAGSDSSTYTAESAYSFRPKRQKRFRDAPDDSDSGAQAPARKRAKRAATPVHNNGDHMMATSESTARFENVAPSTEAMDEQVDDTKKPRIKVVRPGSRSGQTSAAGSTPAPTPPPNAAAATASEEFSRNGTPVSQNTTEGDDGLPKEYRAMTKSEKMSASMKSRCLAAKPPDHLTDLIQIGGRTATWLELSRSERLPSPRRRPLKLQPNSAWECWLPSNRSPEAERRRPLCFLGKMQPSCIASRLLHRTWLTTPTRINIFSRCHRCLNSRCRTTPIRCLSMRMGICIISPILTATRSIHHTLLNISTGNLFLRNPNLITRTTFHRLSIIKHHHLHPHLHITTYILITNLNTPSILITSILARVTPSNRGRTLIASLLRKKMCERTADKSSSS